MNSMKSMEPLGRGKRIKGWGGGMEKGKGGSAGLDG
jgi:hypothetical protein